MEAVEDVGRVLAGNRFVDQGSEPAGMKLGELTEIVDDRIDDNPLGWATEARRG